MKKKIISANGTLTVSTDPLSDINLMSYPGQLPSRKMYKSGYEPFLAQMPFLDPNDEFLQNKIEYSKGLMLSLADKLKKEADWLTAPLEGGVTDFNRIMLAIESPLKASMDGSEKTTYVVETGAEIVVGKWGEGMETPIHGHSAGLSFEMVLAGKMLVNIFRKVETANGVVARLVKTDIASAGTITNANYQIPGTGTFKRENYIHSIKAIDGQAASLHYFTEHTRDGRSNGFQPQYFEDVYKLDETNTKRITSKEGMYLQKGEVALVRSSSVPEFGSHFIVVTGHPVMKDHGMRVQTVTLSAPHDTLLSNYPDDETLVMLKLNKEATAAFLEFHGITKDNDEIIFPS